MFGRSFLIAGYCILMALALPARGMAQSMKAPVEGLVDMQAIGFYRNGANPAFTLSYIDQFPGEFGGVVLNLTWRQLQPAQDGPLSTVLIDSALAKVRSYNRENPTHPLSVKLRVWGGFTAPDWAKNLAGGAVDIPDTLHGAPAETLGRYWTMPYRQAWRAFQSRLAGRYDRAPLIREVAVTSCAWATDEPFVQWIGPANGIVDPNFTNLAQAGYTAAAEANCLREAPADYAAWKTTDLDYPFNPLQMYLPEKVSEKIPGCQHVAYGTLRFCSSDAVGKAVMLECWHSRRCVLSNQALGKSTGPGFPYDFMATIGKKDPHVLIDFQTASPASISGAAQLCQTVAEARTYHARSVELWPSAFTSLTSQEIAVLASVMAGQGSCGALAR